MASQSSLSFLLSFFNHFSGFRLRSIKYHFFFSSSSSSSSFSSSSSYWWTFNLGKVCLEKGINFFHLFKSIFFFSDTRSHTRLINKILIINCYHSFRGDSLWLWVQIGCQKEKERLWKRDEIALKEIHLLLLIKLQLNL